MNRKLLYLFKGGLSHEAGQISRHRPPPRPAGPLRVEHLRGDPGRIKGQGGDFDPRPAREESLQEEHRTVHFQVDAEEKAGDQGK